MLFPAWVSVSPDRALPGHLVQSEMSPEASKSTLVTTSPRSPSPRWPLSFLPRGTLAENGLEPDASLRRFLRAQLRPRFSRELSKALSAHSFTHPFRRCTEAWGGVCPPLGTALPHPLSFHPLGSPANHACKSPLHQLSQLPTSISPSSLQESLHSAFILQVPFIESI